MKVRQIASIAALALLLPTAAHAQTAAPPGSAAVDQYREQAPPAGSNGSKLTKDRRRELESRGPEGRALADALDRNGGVPSADGAGSAAGDGATGSTPGGTAGGGSGGDGPSSGDDGKTADDDAGRGSSAGSGSQGGAEGSDSSADATGTRTTSLAESSATSTVGGLPVWGLLVGAMAIVGVGAVVRGRRAS